ncbi:MAG TPA: S8 family serine peptidase, partial [Thermoleophilaceae bacterium]
MRSRLLLSISVVAALALGSAPAADADVFGPLGSTDPSTQTGTGHYLVKFTAGTSEADQAAALAAAGATELSSVDALRLHTVSLPDGAADQLRSDPSVERVETEGTREATGVPNDPAYDSQWALPRIGWDQVFGSEVSGSATVALLDTGVDASHPDLAANVVPGTSMLDSGGTGTSDSNGHGTAMAGIVAASTDNGEGVAGIGYAGVKVMPVTVLDGSGTGQDGDIIDGVVWAADHGADVILMPFSSADYSASLQDAIDYAWSKGAVLVAATGNDGSSAAHYPAGDRGVVGVGNTDEADALNPSSNFGPALFMAAPGTGIRTTEAGGGYGDASGTSASAAMVAGAAGLLRAASPGADNGVVVGRLARNADPTPNEDTGNGRLSLPRAMGDDSTDSVKPEGTAPVGGGGPVVGPYRAASNGILNGVVRDSTTNALLSGVTVAATCPDCNGAPTVSYTGGGTITDATGAYSVAFSYGGGGPATVTVTASKPGYVAIAGSSGSLTCTTNGNCPTATRDLVLQPSVRSTTTSVSCTPGSVVLNEASSCTATVTDSAAGTPASPSG